MNKFKQGAREWWAKRGNRSIYFFIALFLHFIVILMIASWVIFRAPAPEKEDFGKVFVPPSAPPPPPPSSATPTVTVSPTMVPLTPTAITSQTTMPTFSVPMPTLTQASASASHATAPHVNAPSANGNIASRLHSIAGTVGSWRGENNIREASNDVHNLVAKFPVFLAEYQGGDWNCNNYYHGDNPVTVGGLFDSGALPNLCEKIGEWSHKSLTAQPPKAISISSPELISSPPPFIFFTGHTDFHLTEAEVTNLQKYLQIGGAIWGDSAFAGSGSRFDVAFHREMKRVLPDEDKNFQPLPADHEIFTKSWFPITDIPKGMNYRKDPVEIINLDGKLAVIYTPNDYSDLMTLHLAPGSDNDTAQKGGSYYWAADAPLVTKGIWFDNSASYYRNYVPSGAMGADKLAMNIIAHLLIRFDDKLQMAP